MNENQSRRFFIPPWLDDLGVKAMPFRILCHLLRRAGEDGRCYPAAPSIAAACLCHVDTVWPHIKTLENAGIIRRLPKSFQGANCYLITPPTTGKPPVIEDSPTTGNSPVPTTGKTPAPITGSFPVGRNPSEEIPMKKSNLSDLFAGTEPKPSKIGKETIEEIYLAYPRKVAKKPALKAIKEALKKHPAEYLLERVKVYAAAIGWQDRKWIPHPATWFNEERFEDDPSEWQAPTNGTNGKAEMNFGMRKAPKFTRQTIHDPDLLTQIKCE